MMLFKNPDEMLETLETKDLYCDDLAMYVFKYNDKNAVCKYIMTKDQAIKLASSIDDPEEKWSSELGPGREIYDNPYDLLCDICMYPWQDTDDISKFRLYVDTSDIVDTLQLDSDTEICAYYDNNKGISSSVFIKGEVRVTYKGETYKTPSEFPEELKKLIKKDREWENNDDVYVSENNWAELYVYDEADEILDSEIIDIEKLSPTKLYVEVVEKTMEIVQNNDFQNQQAKEYAASQKWLWDILKNHFGHKVEIAVYGDPENPSNVCLEDMDTNEVILDAELYTLVARDDKLFI